MPEVGYELWVFVESADFGESVVGYVVPLPPETVIFKAVYVGAEGVHRTQEDTKRALAADLTDSRNDVYLMRPVASTDGPPFRAALIYRPTQTLQVNRLDPRFSPAHVPVQRNVQATVYHAIRPGGAFPWEQDFAAGRQGYFRTGEGGTELWRVARLERDALNRQVLTLAPGRLAYALAVPTFEIVPDVALRQHLAQHFEGFQHAVAAGAHLDVVDRAFNVAEGILGYALARVSRAVPSTLSGRIEEARRVVADKGLRASFPVTPYALALADKIRNLHRHAHADQAVERRRTVRPEVGMTVASDLSELLVEVKLARYWLTSLITSAKKNVTSLLVAIRTFLWTRWQLLAVVVIYFAVEGAPPYCGQTTSESWLASHDLPGSSVMLP